MPIYFDYNECHNDTLRAWQNKLKNNETLKESTIITLGSTIVVHWEVGGLWTHAPYLNKQMPLTVTGYVK